jgi:hypothetical protein
LIQTIPEVANSEGFLVQIILGLAGEYVKWKNHRNLSSDVTE